MKCFKCDFNMTVEAYCTVIIETSDIPCVGIPLLGKNLFRYIAKIERKGKMDDSLMHKN